MGVVENVQLMTSSKLLMLQSMNITFSFYYNECHINCQNISESKKSKWYIPLGLEDVVQVADGEDGDIFCLLRRSKKRKIIIVNFCPIFYFCDPAIKTKYVELAFIASVLKNNF